MRKLLNTLYLADPDVYASLDNHNIKVMKDDELVGKYPLLNLEQIFCFSYKGMSAPLIAECVNRHIGVSLFNPNGKFLYRAVGADYGNVLLRKQQYRISEGNLSSCCIASHMIFGKVSNCCYVVRRSVRDHKMRLDIEACLAAVDAMSNLLPDIRDCTDLDSLRGLEGKCADSYFRVFDHLILNQKEDFFFHGRNRRPPMDRMNALLSFGYMLLEQDCASACCGAGLDAYIGFMHRDRPGRKSLACDLMEELRPIFVDRFVLTLVNNRQVSANDFEVQADGAVFLSSKGRKIFLRAWQERKQTEITHPYLKEKVEWGLVPYVQALLLARFLRGDLDAYPPFLWK